MLKIAYCATLLAIASGNAAAQPTGADKPPATYAYYLHVEVTDGADMNALWPALHDCLRAHKYRTQRGSYVEVTEQTDGFIPLGTINDEGSDAIVGPFNSPAELEAATETVKECLESVARQLDMGTLSHWLISFKKKT